MSLLPKSILDNLRCVHCRLCLSVPPIMYNGKNLVCGRCTDQVPHDVIRYRATALEVCFPLLSFPCQYVEHGCTNQQLAWGLVQYHESRCMFRPQDCPLMGKGCKLKTSVKKLPEHFETHHRELMLQMDTSTRLLPLDMEEIQLVSFKSNYFVVHSVSDCNNKVWLGVYFLQQDEHAKVFTYTLEIEQGKNPMLFKNNAVYDYQWKFLDAKAVEIDVMKNNFALFKIAFSDTTVHAEESPGCYTVEKLGLSSNKIWMNVDKKVRSKLKCPACKKSMVPPIFMCSKGHSVCGECKNTSHSCPNCSTLLDDTRNYFLEERAKEITYHCKNEGPGCKFVGSYVAMSTHQEICIFNKITCPLKSAGGKECLWTGKAEICYTHVVFAIHKSQVWKDKKKLVQRHLGLQPTVTYNVMSYEGRVFRICCRHSLQTAGAISWSIQQIGLRKGETSPYTLEIEFLDQTNTRKFVMDSVCLQFTGDKGIFKEAITIPYELLNPFIDFARVLKFNYKLKRV